MDYWCFWCLLKKFYYSKEFIFYFLVVKYGCWVICCGVFLCYFLLWFCYNILICRIFRRDLLWSYDYGVNEIY